MKSQYDDMIADEVNVKEVRHILGMSERGEVALTYVRSERRYKWELDGRFVKWASAEAAEKILWRPRS